MRWEKLFSQWGDDFQTLLDADFPQGDGGRGKERQSLLDTCRVLKASKRPVRLGTSSGQVVTLHIRGIGQDFISGETLEDTPRAGYVSIDDVDWIDTGPVSLSSAFAEHHPTSKRPSSPRLMDVLMRVIPPPRDVIVDTRTQRWRGQLVDVGVDYLELVRRSGFGLSEGRGILLSRHGLQAVWLDDHRTWG